MQRVPFMFMTNPVCRLNLGLTTRTKGGSKGYCSGNFISSSMLLIPTTIMSLAKFESGSNWNNFIVHFSIESSDCGAKENPASFVS